MREGGGGERWKTKITSKQTQPSVKAQYPEVRNLMSEPQRALVTTISAGQVHTNLETYLNYILTFIQDLRLTSFIFTTYI